MSAITHDIVGGSVAIQRKISYYVLPWEVERSAMLSLNSVRLLLNLSAVCGHPRCPFSDNVRQCLIKNSSINLKQFYLNFILYNLWKSYSFLKNNFYNKNKLIWKMQFKKLYKLKINFLYRCISSWNNSGRFSNIFRNIWDILWKYLRNVILKLFRNICVVFEALEKEWKIFHEPLSTLPACVEWKERTTAAQSYTNAFCAGIGPAPTSRLLRAAIRVYEIIV